MKNKITQDDHEKLKVLNLLMWLQASLYAADECETVKWFYNHQTKMLMKRLNESIQREHGKTITELWNVDGAILPDITRQLDDFTYEMATYGYWMLPELTKLIQNAKEESEKVEVVSNEKVL
jgi:hypothetical protein